MLVNPLQLTNASIPILVTLSGMVMLVKLLQLANADFPILVTGKPSYSLGITMFVSSIVPIPTTS